MDRSKKNLLSVFCGSKSKSEIEFETDVQTSSQCNIPLPIDELVDYTDDTSSKPSWKQKTHTQIFTGGDTNGSTSANDPEAITFKKGKLRVPKKFDHGQNVEGAANQPTVKRAEGISIKSGWSIKKDSGKALSELQDLMGQETPVEDNQEVVVVVGLQSSAPVKDSGPPAAACSGASEYPKDQSATETSLSHREFTDPSDVQALKRTVRRLTAELSRLLTAPRADGKTADEVDSVKLLPGKGPLPPWLCDPRVFAPLMAAYEDQLASTGNSGDTSAADAQLLDMEARVLDVVRENERLRVKLREASVAEPASQTEWDTFTEQARLVLEENQLLIQQLSVQQAKAQMAQRGYMEEAAKLKYRIEELEAENIQARAEFESLHSKLQEVKQKFHSAAMERETGEMQTVDHMRSLSKELLDTREEFLRANEELLRQLQKSEREKVKLTQALADAASERDSLRVNVPELRSAIQLKQKEIAQLQKASKKRDSMHGYLDSVVNAATDLQEELETCRDKLDDQDADLNKLMGYLVNELKYQEKNNGQEFDHDSLDKISKLTRKLEFLIKRLVAILKQNEDKREEMAKQVCYLQALIREKTQQMQVLEAEHRTVQAGLETVWNAAKSS